MACLALASVAKMGGSVDRKGQAWERHGEEQGDSSRDSAVQVHRHVGIELCPDGPKAQEAHETSGCPAGALLTSKRTTYLRGPMTTGTHVSFLQSVPQLGVGSIFQVLGGSHCL